MARLQRKDLAKPDEVREFAAGSRVEIFQLEDVVVGRTVWQPGWRWSEVVKPIAGTELCEYHHLGYSISGRFRVEMPDGTEMEIPPNHVYEIPSGHDAWVVGDEPWVAIDWAGMRSFARPMAGRGERIVTTLLFTDIVDSTARAAALGDARWRSLLDAHDRAVRDELTRFRGREINTTGDGFVASFDSPTRAIRCARAIVAAARRVGIEVRCGLHSGECEVRGDDLSGITVHVAARVGALAHAAEVLASSTVRDLAAGSGVVFASRGEQSLKGVPGTWSLFAAEV